jgi:hypothetical protein
LSNELKALRETARLVRAANWRTNLICMSFLGKTDCGWSGDVFEVLRLRETLHKQVCLRVWSTHASHRSSSMHVLVDKCRTVRRTESKCSQNFLKGKLAMKAKEIPGHHTRSWRIGPCELTNLESFELELLPS